MRENSHPFNTFLLPQTEFVKNASFASSKPSPETGVGNWPNLVPYSVQYISPKKPICNHSPPALHNSSQNNTRRRELKDPRRSIQRKRLDARPGRYKESVLGSPPVSYEAVSEPLEAFQDEDWF